MQIRKEEIKLYLFTNNMIIYVENPKKIYEKETCEFSKDTGYSVNAQNSRSKQSKIETCKKHLKFHEKMKYLEINLTKSMQDLFDVNYQTS